MYLYVSLAHKNCLHSNYRVSDSYWSRVLKMYPESLASLTKVLNSSRSFGDRYAISCINSTTFWGDLVWWRFSRWYIAAPPYLSVLCFHSTPHSSSQPNTRLPSRANLKKSYFIFEKKNCNEVNFLPVGNINAPLSGRSRNCTSWAIMSDSKVRNPPIVGIWHTY